MTKLLAFDIKTTFYGTNFSFADVGQLFTSLLPNIILFAGIIFLILIMYYGFRLIQLADSHNPQQLARATSAVTYSFMGFLLVISAYFILQIAGVITGLPLLTPPI